MKAATLQAFLGLGEPPQLVLCLPEFEGGHLATENASNYRYGGVTHADRDVRSAEHVQALGHVAGATVVHLSPAALVEMLSKRKAPGTVVVFGSRSNNALSAVMSKTELGELASFTFGPAWTIRTRSGKTYSLRDPSQVDQQEYESATDFGLVAGYLRGGEPSLFVLAGLGGRATEGCGLFLRMNWSDIAARSLGHSFAALLRFPAPVDPAQAELAEFLTI